MSEIADIFNRLAKTVRTWTDTSDETYTEAARLLGLPPPAQRSLLYGRKLSGVVAQRQVHIRDTSTQNTKGISYVVMHPAMGLGLRLLRHSRMTKVVGFGGWADELIDDPEFTEQFRIETNAREIAAELLGPELRSQLLAMLDRYPTLEVGETQVSVQQNERPKSGAQIASTINDLIDLSWAVAGRGPDVDQAASQPAAPPMTQQPPMAPQSPAAPSANPNPGPPPPPTTTPAPVEASGTPGPPSSPVRPPRIIVPDVSPPKRVPPPPGRPIIDVPASRPPVVDDAIVESTPDPVVSGPAIPGDQLEQLTAIFAAGPLRSRASFDREFAGRPVAWTGSVRSAVEFKGDVHFGRAEGVKATVAVGEITVPGFGTLMIEAVVHLPEGTELRAGDDATFRGVLLKLDGLTRDIFVANGSLA